jgi:hypothetical protein
MREHAAARLLAKLANEAVASAVLEPLRKELVGK